MPPKYLKETTMSAKSRQMLRVTLPEAENAAGVRETRQLVEDLMGKNSQSRFDFIQKNAHFVDDIDV